MVRRYEKLVTVIAVVATFFAIPGQTTGQIAQPDESKVATPQKVRRATTVGETVREAARDIPVAYDVDVVVCGGGIGGTIAAITAGRYGAKTLVIDRFGRFGGNMGPGMFAGGSLHFAYKNKAALVNRTGLGGVAAEFMARIMLTRPAAEVMAKDFRKEWEKKNPDPAKIAKFMTTKKIMVGGGGRLPGYYGIDSHVVSYVAFEMLEEAGVEMLLSAYVTAPIVEGNQVKGVFVETKSGRIAVKAKITIDATGDADIAFRAGAPTLKNPSPSPGMAYAIGGVDPNNFKRPKGMSKAVGSRRISAGLKNPQGGGNLVFGRTGCRGKVDLNDARDLTIMEREHRKLIFEYAAHLRKTAPGFENSYLLIVTPFFGGRGGRCIESVYRLTGSDLSSKKHFPDVMYPYDNERSAGYAEFPYRMLLPKKINGLLAAGRSAFYYGPNFRQRYHVLLHGRAVGLAAAMSVREGIEPRDMDIKKFQRALLAEGCPVGDDERLKELGLK